MSQYPEVSTSTLIATGGYRGAGIGGRNNSGNCGNIEIWGGNITATGGGADGYGADRPRLGNKNERDLRILRATFENFVWKI